jgi:hypothetical protein
LVLSPVILEPHPIGTLGKMWRLKHSLLSFHSALLFSLIPRLDRHRSTSCLPGHRLTPNSIRWLLEYQSISHGGGRNSCSSLHNKTAYYSGSFSGSLVHSVHSLCCSILSVALGPRTLACILRWESVLLGRLNARLIVALPRTRKFNSSSSCQSGSHCFVCSSSHDRQSCSSPLGTCSFGQSLY